MAKATSSACCTRHRARTEPTSADSKLYYTNTPTEMRTTPCTTPMPDVHNTGAAVSLACEYLTTQDPSSVKADHPLTYVPMAMAPELARMADTVAAIPKLARRMYGTISSGLRT